MAEVALIATVAATAFSAYQQYEGAKDAEQLAKEQADRQKAEAEEMARRAEKDASRQESLARARAAASGIGAGGSTALYMSELEKTQREEIDWIRRAGASQARLTRKEGRWAYRRGMAGAVSTAASGVTGGYDWYQKYVK